RWAPTRSITTRRTPRASCCRWWARAADTVDACDVVSGQPGLFGRFVQADCRASRGYSTLVGWTFRRDRGGRAMKLIAAMVIRPAIALAIGLAALVSSQSASLAQTKQIKLIVPYAPGGAPDVAARVLGEEIGRAHNATVVVENRPGAGSIIASELVARA